MDRMIYGLIMWEQKLLCISNNEENCHIIDHSSNGKVSDIWWQRLYKEWWRWILFSWERDRVFSILRKDPRIEPWRQQNKFLESYRKALYKTLQIPVTFLVAIIFKINNKQAIRWSISPINWKMSILINYL